MKARALPRCLAVLFIIVLAGCAANSKFTPKGIPHARYLVGGGFEIAYVAPSDGTAFWVEEITEKILRTESLEEGELLDLGNDMHIESYQRFLGIGINESKFSLYFIPAPTKRELR